MRVLVTGGAGFIGSDLVRRLPREGFSVSVIDKLTYAGDIKRIAEVLNMVKFYKEDITNSKKINEIFEKEKPEIVVHYAAETHVDRSILDPDTFFHTNVIGTLHLLKASLKYKVKKFIHISTDEVYGELPLESKEKFTEKTPLQPNSPYSASKASADMLVRSFIETFELPAIIVRASNNYGPWQYPEKLIPLAISKLLCEEKIPIYGTGQNIRTWLYVEDFTEAILQIIDKGKEREVYNVGSSEEKKNIDVIKKLLDILNKSEDYIEFIPDRPGHDLRYAVDTTKIQKEIGWKPKVSFEEGLRKTVEWYIDNKEWLFEKKKHIDMFVQKLKEEFGKRS